MKKTIVGTLAAAIILSAGNYVNADYENVTAIPTLYDSVELYETPTLYGSEKLTEEVLKKLLKKHEIVLRNNRIKSDREYNNTHYYTKKFDTSKIVIPEEIKEKAKDIYFLIEEGRSIPVVYFDEAVNLKQDRTEEVKDVYNYKKVDFNSSKNEYLFNTKDLVKELKDDEFKSVTITLMADFDDDQKVALASPEYFSIQTKESILNNLLSNQDLDSLNNYNYYNSDDIEQYLEKLSSKMKRSDYKKMINNAGSKIKKMIKTTEDKNEDLLKSIKRESDLEKSLDTYKSLKDTSNLLNNLNRAVKSQIFNIRTFDAIDSILKSK